MRSGVSLSSFSIFCCGVVVVVLLSMLHIATELEPNYL
jgi:hypothetical protein